jgi:hypothetical protein
MRVGRESSWVLFNLAQLEASSGVLSLEGAGGGIKTSCEWALLASERGANFA